MKPVQRKALKVNTLLQGVGFGSLNTIGSIKGSVKKLGSNYSNATVVLFNKTGLLPLAIRRPNEVGDYEVFGLNLNLICFIAAFDSSNQYNAVIQDNVVPK